MNRELIVHGDAYVIRLMICKMKACESESMSIICYKRHGLMINPCHIELKIGI